MKSKNTIIAALIILNFQFSIFNLSAQSVYSGQHEGKIKLPLKAEIKAYSFDLKDVKLLPSRFTENMERDSKWILSLSTGRLLQSFRNTAGVFSSKEGGYSTVKKLGGWEALDCDLRGHTTGHILSALSYFYASTGDERYKLKADSLVKGLAEVQDAYGNGFISAYSENLINRNIAGRSVWAPWYTLHKIYAGLIDQYLYSDNQQALDVMLEAASWAYKKLKPLTKEQQALMLRNEFGGTNDVFYNLYSITGNPEHKWLAEFFYHAEVLDPLAAHENNLPHKHANTFIPKITGEARNYELSNNKRSKDIADFFWQNVVEYQTYCTGGNSTKEKFIDNNKISENLTGYTQESCNTNNMLKLTRHLFCWDADPKYADFYERALYNHILGQQDPESGMVAYFSPLLSGAHKVYSTPENSFWCCVGTGFENHAKYGEAIYYHNDNDLYVNLFIPSELNWKAKNVKIVQETQFPEKELVTFSISTSQPQRLAINLRYPGWAEKVNVKINGKSVKIKQIASSYITLDRVWKNGDKIEVVYPMKLQIVEANDNPDKIAFMYGPLVLAGAMGTEGMVSPAPFSNPQLHNDYYTYDYHLPAGLQTSLSLNRNRLSDYIKPSENEPLTFKALKENIILKPIHQIHRQRYVVYWDILNKPIKK